MKLATLSDFDLVMSYFNHHKALFPHVRHDKIREYINNGQVILEDDVVITFRKYQKRTKLGNIYTEKGDVIINQIASLKSNKGNGTRVLQRFLNWVDTRVWLTVRFENVALWFYYKNGFYVEDAIQWKDGTIDGVVMSIMPTRNDLSKFMTT